MNIVWDGVIFTISFLIFKAYSFKGFKKHNRTSVHNWSFRAIKFYHYIINLQTNHTGQNVLYRIYAGSILRNSCSSGGISYIIYIGIYHRLTG